MKKMIAVQGTTWEISTAAREFIEVRVMKSGGSNNDTEVYCYDAVNEVLLSVTGITCSDEKSSAILSAVKELFKHR
jgi:hypothetical protein